MRNWGFSQINTKNTTRKFFTVSTFLLISACSPLSNRLEGPANDGGVYPLTDSFVTNSISPRAQVNNLPSRRVTSRSLAPIEEYETVRPVATSYRKPNNGVVVVRSGDTLLGVAREYDVDAVDLAEINALDAPYGLEVGQELALPGTSAARKRVAKRKSRYRTLARSRTVVPRSKKPRTTTVSVVKTKKIKIAKVVIPHKKAAYKRPKEKARKKPVRIASIRKPLVRKKPAVRQPSAKLPAVKKRKATVGNKFRWPIRGRVISEFGSKSNGARNDGINLSVPKGAAIVAAENGVVVYSGNELKGYGNLVLIRHKGGWSTAYAHISKMLVKKGQKVRRGQVIAKAGQTGSVSRPQLHFEIRRGTDPVNPRKYLSGTKVAAW